jgi:protein transport protein SEC24
MSRFMPTGDFLSQAVRAQRDLQPQEQQYRPPVAPQPGGYSQHGTPFEQPQQAPYGGVPVNGQAPYGAPVPTQQGYFAPPAEQFQQQQPMQEDPSGLAAQMGGLGMGQIGQDHYGTARSGRKKNRHAYHNLETEGRGAAQPLSPSNEHISGPFGGAPFHPAQQPGAAPQAGPYGGPPGQAPAAIHTQGLRSSTPLAGVSASSAQGKVDPEHIPSIPRARDAPAQYYTQNVYTTLEHTLPPPAAVPFVAIDQGNSNPKFARLTVNTIPATSTILGTTGLPLGLILQPLAKLQEGEQPVPTVDFGEAGPPRCRRCRTYINPFMVFRSGGNKIICNMCTHANETPPEYYAPTDQSGVRVDRLQRPELQFGAVDFAAPKEYWTKDPVPLRWLFLIDVSMEAISKGFTDAMCEGIKQALYSEANAVSDENGKTNGSIPGVLAPGSRVGIATFDREAHFYSLNPKLKDAQMVVMPDLEDPFPPVGDGLFVEPEGSKEIILQLLTQIPRMFSKIKNPEPALLPMLTTAVEALKLTGGKIVCSLAALPTFGPGRLFLREKPEMRDTDAEKKLFTTEHPGFLKLTRTMTENGVGVDFFLAAPQGGYLDIATIGHVSEKTGGEVYYYPNFHQSRDELRVAKEIKHTITRDTGFQALMKVRCSNGLQVAGYFGSFTQHTFGADLEYGVIDADKAFGVTFSYDGKLDSKLDAHFQAALLYTTASGHRRIRCINLCATVTEHAMDAMKGVDQDAVIGILAKQSACSIPSKSLKDVRGTLTEKTVDILSAYRKNFSGSHPPGQLVLPENLKEFSMYMLGLLKTRAFKAGIEPTDRRIHDLRLVKSMSPLDLSLYLYPRLISIHNLDEADGFPGENGYLKMPAMSRASYSRIDDGGAYILDCGQICLLWIHAQVSPNLLEDLFGEGRTSLQALYPFTSKLPVLQTHLSAQVRNILQWLEDNRGSKGLVVQLARQGLDGAEYEFARLLVEDRNNEAQSYVDWLVHVHRHVQLELQGQRKKGGGGGGGDGEDASMFSFARLTGSG